MTTTRYFLTYSGVALPLALTQELAPDALAHRNTYFQATYDAHGRMVRCEKRVYGDVEMTHEYAWTASGQLARATITIGDEEPQVMAFAPPA